MLQVGALNVTRIYSIIGATKISKTEVYFTTAQPGTFVHVRAGQANVTKSSAGVIEWTRKICEADGMPSKLESKLELEARDGRFC